ncbi:MAG: 50S ribosomal protein L6 [Dehalococcoidia bacterium]|nr:50S ribosomal protein L6 [Dehalococcoidia bacterium]
MSRVGNKPIAIPKGVQVTVSGSSVTTKGPKGQLTQTFNPVITITQKEGTVIVARTDEERLSRSLHGLTRTLIYNMLEGVEKGYQKSLEIVGVGYRASKQGDRLVLQVGTSKPMDIAPPQNIQFDVEGQNRVHIRGIDKQLVGQTAAAIRSKRPPDRYKGKGIRYVGEVVKLKPGKAAAKKKA